MWYKVASKPEITGTSAKFWPKSQKIPLISEKTQANLKRKQGKIVANLLPTEARLGDACMQSSARQHSFQSKTKQKSKLISYHQKNKKNKK